MGCELPFNHSRQLLTSKVLAVYEGAFFDILVPTRSDAGNRLNTFLF